MVKMSLDKKVDDLTKAVGRLTLSVERGFKLTAQRFSTIEKSMESGFAAVAEDIAELRGDVTGMKETMGTLATKEQVFALQLQIAGIEGEIKSFRRDLDEMAKKIEGLAEYKKDIDILYKRLDRVEEQYKTLTKRISA